jgi:hypothetical protein
VFRGKGDAGTRPTCDARIAAYVLRSGPQRLRESEVPADQVVEYWGSRHLVGPREWGGGGGHMRDQSAGMTPNFAGE